MSQVSPPQTLAVGVSTGINPPSPNPWGAVAIQNLSPYLVEVQAGAQVAWLAPFTSDLFTPGASNSPVAVTPQAVAGTVANQLLGGAQIQATWFDPTEAAALAASYPAALPGSAILASSAPPGVVFGPQAIVPSGGAISESIPIPSNARTLVITLTTSAGALITCSVIGNQSGQVYRTGLYYLVSQGGIQFQFIVPVNPAADSSVTIAFANVPGTSATVEVWADSLQYEENVFYNGQAEAATATASSGSATIITGPARLLTAQLEALSPGANSSFTLRINNIVIARADLTTNAPMISVPLTFPPNTILPAGQAFTVNSQSATAVGSLVFAYP